MISIFFGIIWVGYRIKLYLLFLEICQIYNMLIYVNVFLPQNLETFLHSFDVYNMKFDLVDDFMNKNDDKYHSERETPR